MDESNKFYGKYRGTVVNNTDPMQMGRIQALVPDVSDTTLTSWAMPCIPLADKQMGAFLVPQVGSGVWMEFERGEPDHPIWAGCFWNSDTQAPVIAPGGAASGSDIVLQTAGHNSFVICP